MLRILLAALFLPMVLGSKCCLPNKFYARKTDLDTGLQFQYVMDYGAGKIAEYPKAKSSVFFVLRNMNSMYSFTKFNTGACTANNLNKMNTYPQCIPDIATLVAGDSTSPTYSFLRGDRRITIQVFNTGVAKQCLPMKVIITHRKTTMRKQFKFNDVSKMSDTSKWTGKPLSNCRYTGDVIG